MEEHTHVRSRDMSALYTPIAIIVAGVLVAVGLYAGLSHSGTGGVGAQQPKVDVKNVDTKGVAAIGKENAPLTIAYWSDYQCPWCKKFELEVLPNVIRDYVDTGKVRIVFKDYPFLGEDSTTAAHYAHAIWELFPNKYFEWREDMYNAQDDEGDQGFGDAASIDALTAKVQGIDLAAVKARVASMSGDYDQKISASIQEGSSMGISGTPGFIVGKQLIGGFVDYASFKQTVDQEL